jgi:hypothetical protein
MKSQNILSNLDNLISQAEELENLVDMPRLHKEYEQWYSKSVKMVKEFLPDRLSSFSLAYSYITNYLLTHPSQPGVGSRISYKTSLQKQGGILLSVKNEIESRQEHLNAEESIELICHKFHIVAKQLEKRHEERSTIRINDEYDVQDLFYALLRLYFDDIRPEEWSPSYAGGNSRIDFLINNEKIIIEIKRTRSRLKDKEIGEQLIIDIERYKTHPKCRKMICFIYDPEELLRNPKGLQNDLECSENEFSVRMIISPLK